MHGAIVITFGVHLSKCGLAQASLGTMCHRHISSLNARRQYVNNTTALDSAHSCGAQHVSQMDVDVDNQEVTDLIKA